MLMFVCTETSPSIHPDVLNYIKQYANAGNAEAGSDDEHGGGGGGGHAAESKEGGRATLLGFSFIWSLKSPKRVKSLKAL